ncbi:hypothetical protein [Streptomyces sp. NPDC002537]
MDPPVAQVGSAIVAAAASDAWRQASNAVSNLFRRAHPERAEEIDTKLSELRAEALEARGEQGSEMERALETLWTLRLRRLLTENPQLTSETQRILDEEIIPVLDPHARHRAASFTQNVQGSQQSQIIQAGGDVVVRAQPPQP